MPLPFDPSLFVWMRTLDTKWGCPSCSHWVQLGAQPIISSFLNPLATRYSTGIPSLLTHFFNTAAAGTPESTKVSSLHLFTLQGRWLLTALCCPVIPPLSRKDPASEKAALLSIVQAETETAASQCAGCLRCMFLFTLGMCKAGAL